MTRIKELRREKAETQESIAALIGITRGAYANIENGKREPDIKTMTVLAAHFGVSVDYLLRLTDKKEQPPAESEELSSADLELLKAYREAPANVRSAIRTLLGDE